MMGGSIDQVSVWTEPLPIDKIWNTWGWLLGLPTSQ
jgi:hypothetical protein